MKVYEAVYTEEETQGVYALSVVENPAMEDMWIALSNHPKKIEFSQVDESKRLLLGAALIPNKKIYRNIDGQEFEMFFKEETIEKLAHSFMKNQQNNNSSLEHELKLEGMSVVEAWTVNDPLTDKSASYGKQYPKGTWVTMMKVDNDDVWNKVKSGEIKGFSIDAILKLEEFQLKADIKMTEEFKKDIITQVVDGVKSFLFNKEETKEDVVASPETIAEVAKDAEVVDLSTDALKEALSEVLAQFTKDVDAKIDAIKLEFDKQIEVKDAEIVAKNKEVEELKVQLEKTPEAKPIKAQLERQPIRDQREFKNMSITDRVFASINE